MPVNERIVITTELRDKFSQAFRKTQKTMTDIGNNMQKMTTVTAGLTAKGKEYERTLTSTFPKQRRFQFQWLSIMFAGMALQRTMAGLVKTAFEWVGIQDLLNATLGIVFLPIAETLLEVLLPILEWFWELPDGAKQALGGIVLFGLGIGTILSTVGQVALGLAGLKWLFGGMGVAAGTAAGKAGLLFTGLKKLAGIGLIAVSIGLAIDVLSRTGEKISGTSELLKVLGSGIAAGLGAALLGVSLPAAIVIGGITATAIISWRIINEEPSIEKALKIGGTTGLLGNIKIGGLPGLISQWARGEFQNGGIVPGSPSTPVPIIAHGGETVVPSGKSMGNNVTVSPVYNISILDNDELERKLRDHDYALVNDIKRLISV